MKIIYLISITMIVGILILFFFPEPETNFLAYVGTALFFVFLIVLLIIKYRKQK